MSARSDVEQLVERQVLGHDRDRRGVSHQRVLVVEDDRDLVDIYVVALAGEGCDVQSAPDGHAALDIAARWSPDLIILDLGLPVLDGLGFAREYRIRPGPHASIIAISAAPDVEARSVELGAHAWLPKPFDLEALVQLARDHLPLVAPDLGIQPTTPVIASRTISPGGTNAVGSDGRPIPVAGSACRALIRDRGEIHQCRRRGWFALREADGKLLAPLCATHLRSLVGRGGLVTA